MSMNGTPRKSLYVIVSLDWAFLLFSNNCKKCIFIFVSCSKILIFCVNTKGGKCIPTLNMGRYHLFLISSKEVCFKDGGEGKEILVTKKNLSRYLAETIIFQN